MSVGWGVAAAITTWLTLSFSSPEVRGHMRDFWAEGFLPWSDGLVAVFVWVPARLYHTLAHYIVFLDADFGVLAAPLALLVVVGIVPLWRRHGIRGVVLLAPVIAGLLGGAVGLLPLRNRLSIHAGAALVLVGMVGLQHLLRAEGGWTRRAGWVVGVLAILPMPLVVATTSRPPLRAPETRPVLEMLGERVGPAERVIAYCWAAPAAEYYGSEAAVSVDRVVECAESESDAVAAARSIEAGRVWFFHTDTPEPRWSAEFMLELESRGEEVDRIVDPHAGLRPGTEAVLYEIGSGS